MSEPQPHDILLWMRAYRLAAVAALLAGAFFFVSAAVSSRKPSCVGEPERINPNTASVASLVRLPGIGKARALDIIHYRQTHASDEPVFKTASDLEAIKGIGPKTAEKLAPWLTFDEK